MSKGIVLPLILGLFLVFTSCQKDKMNLLEGTWEWVNVENINDAYTYEWEFKEGIVTMRRRLKSNPATVVTTDTGVYFLETSPLKTTLQLVDTKQTVINDKWDIIKLDKNQLIMKLDIVGGILLKEFVKIM
jgi:hypothetical protein